MYISVSIYLCYGVALISILNTLCSRRERIGERKGKGKKLENKDDRERERLENKEDRENERLVNKEDRERGKVAE